MPPSTNADTPISINNIIILHLPFSLGLLACQSLFAFDLLDLRPVYLTLSH